MKTDLEAQKEAAVVKISRELQLSPVCSQWSWQPLSDIPGFVGLREKNYCPLPLFHDAW